MGCYNHLQASFAYSTVMLLTLDNRYLLVAIVHGTFDTKTSNTFLPAAAMFRPWRMMTLPVTLIT